MDCLEYKEKVIQAIKENEAKKAANGCTDKKKATLREIIEAEKLKNEAKRNKVFKKCEIPTPSTCESDSLFTTDFYGSKGKFQNTVHNQDFQDKTSLAKDYNPHLRDQDHNFQKTQISEYSNAIHNNRVFVNPRFLSC